MRFIFILNTSHERRRRRRRRRRLQKFKLPTFIFNIHKYQYSLIISLSPNLWEYHIPNHDLSFFPSLFLLGFLHLIFLNPIHTQVFISLFLFYYALVNYFHPFPFPFPFLFSPLPRKKKTVFDIPRHFLRWRLIFSLFQIVFFLFFLILFYFAFEFHNLCYPFQVYLPSNHYLVCFLSISPYSILDISGNIDCPIRFSWDFCFPASSKQIFGSSANNILKAIREGRCS